VKERTVSAKSNFRVMAHRKDSCRVNGGRLQNEFHREALKNGVVRTMRDMRIVSIRNASPELVSGVFECES